MITSFYNYFCSEVGLYLMVKEAFCFLKHGLRLFVHSLLSMKLRYNCHEISTRKGTHFRNFTRQLFAFLICHKLCI